MSVIKPQPSLNYPILSTLLALGILALFMMGCATDPVTGMSYRTEVYTAFHRMPYTENPQTPEQWQAKMNEDCKDPLFGSRKHNVGAVKLPDGNFAWKYSRGMTGCVYSAQFKSCTCTAPTTPGLLPGQNPPNWARVYYKTNTVEMFW